MNFHILGSGCDFPSKVVTSEELDKKFHHPVGTFEKKSGVFSRHYANDDLCSSQMGAAAAKSALTNAKLEGNDVGLIIAASGIPAQAIPCTAALIQRRLGLGDSKIPCFDINSTCLSFLTALNVSANFLKNGQYKKILVVSSEIASVGINNQHIESASLFGDGAAAVVVGSDSTAQTDPTKLLAFNMITLGDHYDCCLVEAGGTRTHPSRTGWSIDENDPRYLFQMNGTKVFKISSSIIRGFVDDLCKKADVDKKDLRLVIPHQASASALELTRRRLGLAKDQWFVYNRTYGNMIAASLPLGLHLALSEGRVKKGDKIMILGTSAGFSMGAMLLQI